MIRRKIDSRRISPRRPDISEKEMISAIGFADTIKKFADEYLRGAMTATVDGRSSSIINVSLYGTAYALRLMVEHTREDSALKVRITIGEHNIKIVVEFPDGTPDMNALSGIARAARGAGFFFELRGSSIILRAPLELGCRVPVYSSNFDKMISIFENVFFI